MPDIITVISKRWKLIGALTLTATLVALVVSLLLPKQYLSIATALPANSLTADKGRIFNNNIESLYPEIGTPDELDRIEGTAKLDTIYIAVAESIDLVPHYAIDKNAADAVYQSALSLKKNTDIRRSAYGELKIKVWDGDKDLAAELANLLLLKLNEIHRQIQSVNNATVLKRLQQALADKQKQVDLFEKDILLFAPANDSITAGFTPKRPLRLNSMSQANNEVIEYQKIISQYELALSINPNVLIPVEYARASPWADKPKTFLNILFAFGAALIFSILLAVFTEGRKNKTWQH